MAYEKSNTRRIEVKPNPSNEYLQKRLEKYVDGIFKGARMDILAAVEIRRLYTITRQIERTSQYCGAGYFSKEKVIEEIWPTMLKVYNAYEDLPECKPLIDELKGRMDVAIKLGMSKPKYIELEVGEFTPSRIQPRRMHGNYFAE